MLIWRRLQMWYAFRLTQRRKFAQAYRFCRRLAEKGEPDAWIHLMLAGLEVDANGDFAKAEYHLSEARQMPNCIASDWHRMHGHILSEQGQVKAAAQECQKAVDLERSVLNLEHLASVLMSHDRPRAKAIWEEILSKAPRDAGAYAGLAAIAGEEGNLGSETALAAKALEIDPRYTYAKEVLEHARRQFLSLRDQGRIAEALAARDVARGAWPHDPEVAAELERLART